MSAATPSTGLSIAQNRHDEVLRALERAPGGLTIRDLARETHRSPAQICSVLVELRNAGTVRQYRGDRDIRRYRFTLAGDGR